ncbi:MAG: DUF4349 domain-containing protein [Ferruginibacter sp.]
MKTKLFISALLIISFFISCNQKAEKSDIQALDAVLSKSEPDHGKNKPDKDQQIPVGTLNTDSTGAPTQTVVTVNPDWDSKIIKTATLRLEIKDFKKYNDYVHNAVKQYGAYVAQEDQNLSDEKLETTITIKVPVAQFEPMMNKLPADESKVMEKKISTEDVTGEVVDTKSRLEAKKQMRLKYLEFLKQSKNMEEVLQVQNEINAIQEQIESAAGRVAFLSNQSAMSTINLTFYQPLEGYKPGTDEPSFLTRVSAAFKTGASWIADLFVGLISIWPLLLVVLLMFFGWKRLRQPKLATQEIKIADQSTH